MEDLGKLIAAISPDVYCDPKARKKVKKIVKEQLAQGKEDAYIKAAKEAKLINHGMVFQYDAAHGDALSAWGLKAPYERHTLTYDSPSEGVEPTYFWILDFISNFGKVDKLIDNFMASPGSGHFSEFGQKATRMQEEAMKMLGAANQVLKSVLNLIYDLKEMKLLLRTYEELQSKDPQTKQAANLSLKQRWMDMVDFSSRGTTSLKQMAAQMDFVTIIDAFMTAKDLNDVDKLDLNLRVKRILKQRMSDYLKWIEESETQLRQRYNIEKKYLHSQVSSIKLYSRWIKPYLRAARKLEQNASSQQAALVTTFNTIIMELKVMGYGPYSPGGDVAQGILPEEFAKASAREYSSIVVVEFEFRGIPQRISQRGDWAFGGKVDVTFTSYALNDQEMAVLKNQIEKDDIGDVMKLIEGTTDKSLGEIQKDIDEFLNEDKKKEEKKKKAEQKEGDVNPFSSLLSFLKPMKSAVKKEKFKVTDPIKPDNFYEKVIRSQAILAARKNCFNTFDIYKRAHRMPAHPNPYDSVAA